MSEARRDGQYFASCCVLPMDAVVVNKQAIVSGVALFFLKSAPTGSQWEVRVC